MIIVRTDGYLFAFASLKQQQQQEHINHTTSIAISARLLFLVAAFLLAATSSLSFIIAQPSSFRPFQLIISDHHYVVYCLAI
jgi:hypothetical protein